LVHRLKVTRQWWDKALSNQRWIVAPRPPMARRVKIDAARAWGRVADFYFLRREGPL